MEQLHGADHPSATGAVLRGPFGSYLMSSLAHNAKYLLTAAHTRTSDGAPRMESATQLALATGACRYQSIKSILKNSLDLRRCRNRSPHRPRTTASAVPSTSTEKESKTCSNNQ
jgi:hypothetical protein